MRISSLKSKGRRLQQEVVHTLRKHYELDKDVEDTYIGDIQCINMGATGKDIKLSPIAEKKIPFDIECKNTEKASVWSWWEQSKSNTKKDRIPLVVFRRNRSETLCLLKFDDLLEVMKNER